MKCKNCNTEMFVDSTTVEGNDKIFHYKCPNKNCSNYGYKEETKDEQN